MWLAIDTSGAETSVAFDRPQQVASQATKVNSHSSSLNNLVEETIKKHGRSFSDVSAIVLGSGPGSFTGLRIGYSYAKGLALANDIAIFPVSSLAAAAWGVRGRAESILVLEDARRSEYFVAGFNSLNFTQILDEQIFSVDQLREWIKNNGQALVVSANPLIYDTLPGTEIVSNLANSLLDMAANQAIGKGYRGAAQTAPLAPVYIREVAAKTIAERALNSC